jgi:mannose-6-phosphate isomerase-like protein (cupin superfamily)
MSKQKLIVNPLSGEQIVILRNAAETGGQVLDWELRLAPGGRVPSSHAHPEQRETFTVQEGTMRFRVGSRRIIAEPGQCVAVPPGTVHHFANAGPVTARVTVESRPALRMEELLETAAAMAQDQHAARRTLPRLTDLALFMTEFEREVAAPYLPRALVRLVMRALARAGRAGRARQAARPARQAPGTARVHN